MKQYYIANTIWQSKFNKDKVKLFDSINYGDNIILYYDFLYSYYKIATKQKQNKLLFIAAINCCLRMKEKLKQLYPYNNIYICLYVKDKNSKLNFIDYDVFKSVIDMIPDFAFITEEDLVDLTYFDNKNNKQIFYGRCSEIKEKLKNSDYQIWNIINGILYIK